MKVSKIFKECCFKCHYGNGIDNNSISDNDFDKSLNLFGKNLKRCVCLDRSSNLNKKMRMMIDWDLADRDFISKLSFQKFLLDQMFILGITKCIEYTTTQFCTLQRHINPLWEEILKQRNSKGNTSTNTLGGMKQDRENQMKALKQKLLGKKINLNIDNSNIIDDENDVGRNRKNKGYYKESSYVQLKKKIDHEAIF